jgi:hypothetical protein
LRRDFLSRFGDLGFRKERDLDSLDNEGVLHEIDTSLMTFQHIKSKE